MPPGTQVQECSQIHETSTRDHKSPGSPSISDTSTSECSTPLSFCKSAFSTALPRQKRVVPYVYDVSCLSMWCRSSGLDRTPLVWIPGSQGRGSDQLNSNEASHLALRDRVGLCALGITQLPYNNLLVTWGKWVNKKVSREGKPWVGPTLTKVCTPYLWRIFEKCHRDWSYPLPFLPK